MHRRREAAEEEQAGRGDEVNFAARYDRGRKKADRNISAAFGRDLGNRDELHVGLGDKKNSVGQLAASRVGLAVLAFRKSRTAAMRCITPGKARNS
jgi:hypothetical protein